MKQLTIFLGLIALSTAKIKCKTYQEKDVVCTPDNADHVLRRGLVSDNNKTTGITLRGCRITDLDYEVFENDFNLQYIDLSVNKISKLKLGVLDGNRQVAFLNISYNQLTTFPLGLFDQYPDLEVLDLKGNKINELQLGIFDPLLKLRHLDLSSNDFLGKNIDPYLFDQTKRIKFMDFSRNDLSGSSEMLLHSFLELDFLNLDRCSLLEVPSFVAQPNLSTMKHLMLSTNQITKLTNPRIFKDLDSLEILNLADNLIDEISADVFTNVRTLRMIVLRNNKIKTLSNTFLNLRNLGNLDLSYNYIEYVPVNALKGTALKNLNLSHNRFTYLEANFCLELKNSGAYLKKFYFNDNPWQCACLNEVMKEAKMYDIGYNTAKFTGNKPVCVTKDFNCKRQSADNDIFIELFDQSIRSI